MKSFYSKNFTLGILGGGQLGRMFIQEAINYDIRIAILDPSHDAPCAAYAHKFVCGDFNDFDTVYEFGKDVDVLTIEIEHVNVEALELLEKEGVTVYPAPAVLRIVKDKGLQKEFYKSHDIPTSDFRLITNKSELESLKLDYPVVQKMRTGGYDGKGVQILRAPADLTRAFDVPSILENFVGFDKELAVIVARNKSGQIKTFPPVQMEFNDEANLVEFLFSPASISEQTEEEAIDLAIRLAEALDFVGLLAVEMFVSHEGNVVVNEIAPRAHNSGHHTIEACTTSQYEQLLRAILNLPLGDTGLITPAVMINLLGEKNHSGAVRYEGLEEVLSMPGTHLHLYGKSTTKDFRKMGHLTVTSDSLDEAKSIARKAMKSIRVVS